MTTRRSRVRAVRYAPARGRLAASALAAGVTVLSVLGVLGIPPVTGSVARAQTTAADLPLTLTVTGISPTAPQPGDELTVAGTLTNPTDLEYDDVSIALRLSPDALTTRSALLAVVASTDHVESDNAGPPIPVSALPAHTSVPYRLQVAVDELPLTTPGVYRISVEAYRGAIENREYDARVNTFLPWLPPSAGVTPVQVAWVWPLLSTPRLKPDDTFLSDDLGVEIGPVGRLGRLLDVATKAAAQTGVVPQQSAPPVEGATTSDPPPTPVQVRPVPVTPVIDPETLQELQLMTGPYVVNGSPGAHSAEATAYLAQLRALMGKTSTIATPYADPDIEGLARAHAGSLVTQARSTGLENGWPGIATGLVWPPDGTLSQSTLDALTTSGLVLSSRAVPLTDPAGLGYTPTGTVAIDRPGGTVPAVVVDDGLSKLATTRVPTQDRALLTQRFAAETAAIAVESGPTAPRTLVLAPGRRWSPTQSSVRSIVAETGRLPWLTPSTVPQVLAAAPDPAATREPLRVPAGQQTLQPSVASGISAADTELARFRSILCPAPAKGSTPTVATPAPTASAGTAGARCNPDDQTLPLQRSLYRVASTAFRRTTGAEALLSSTEATLRADEGKVQIVTHGGEELVGNRAKLPISIVNGLTVPVKVQVELVPHSSRLSAGAPVPLVIPAGGNAQLNLPLNRRAAGSGTLPVDARLLTPSGQPFGAPVTLQVHVSAYGVVVVTITIAVCGLLGLAVIVRIYRRVRNARRRAGEPAVDDAPEPAHDDVPVEPEA